jgi:hypothetical protein
MAIMWARLANTTWAPFGGRSFLAFSRFTTDAGSVEDFNTLNASDATTDPVSVER